MKTRFRVLLLSLFLTAPLASQAAPVTYNFSWLGGAIGLSTSDRTTLHGSFSYDSSSALDGVVRDSEVLSMQFEGFFLQVGLAPRSLGFNISVQTLPAFNFNFDAVNGIFLLGGAFDSDTGQSWNFRGTGVGFRTNFNDVRLSTDLRPANPGPDFGGRPNLLGFTVTLVPPTVLNAVPEPSTAALVGLAGFGLFVRSRARRSRV